SLPNYLCRFTVRAVIVLASGFSRQCEINGFAYSISAPRHSSWLHRADLPALTTHCLDVPFRSHAPSILLRHHITQTDITGTGISACWPSPTHLCLGLGPD